MLRVDARRIDAGGIEDARLHLRIEDDRVVTIGRYADCSLRTDGPGPERAVVFDVASGVRRLHPWAVTEGFVAHGFFGERIDVRGCVPPILLQRPPMLGEIVVGPWRVQFVLAPRMNLAPCMRCRTEERRPAFCVGCGRDLGEPPR